MTNRIVTLIASPDTPCLEFELIARLRNSFGVSDATELSPGVAWEFPAAESASLEAIRNEIAGMPVDVVMQPAGGRHKKLLLADMDSTMIQQECLDELADAAGSGPEVAEITARAMAGEIDFELALRERVATLAGKSADLIDGVLENRITLMPGGKQLVATMRKNGAHCALVSGGFTQFTSAVAGQLGFHSNRANTFQIEDGRFTGDVVEPILGREAKVEALNELSKQLKISPEDAIAVGDGANDLGMLLAAGTGVALHAKPVVAQSAPHRIDHGYLTALLYMQGYRDEDFAA